METYYGSEYMPEDSRSEDSGTRTESLDTEPDFSDDRVGTEDIGGKQEREEEEEYCDA